ncbi:MAG: hypothetical protein COB35_09475 [Gammaproteobacteria bacterium]|nr:MAG: hypothetical protein COB35_09475 [Gammaproteobacteria bacterium]
MSAKLQTFFAVVVSFVFYCSWSWFANHTALNDQFLLLRGALIQGSYSAFMTLTFSSFLSFVIEKMKCHKHPFLAIIPPLMIQSAIVYGINYLNHTPNIMLTITPSIFFTALYGVVFAFTLLKKPQYQCDE